MKIVVDTNIVFSAILNIDSQISRILLFSGKHFEFYSCEFLKMEISNHKNKILKITGYSEAELHDIEYLVTKNIHFMNHMLICDSLITKAEQMLMEIDKDDAPFLAMTLDLKAKLWTGDKKLENGLIKQNFKNVVNTSYLVGKLY